MMTESTGIDRSAATGVACGEANQPRTSRLSSAGLRGLSAPIRASVRLVPGMSVLPFAVAPGKERWLNPSPGCTVQGEKNGPLSDS